MPSPPQPNHARISRRWPLITGVLAVVLAAVIGALVVVRETVPDIDSRWMAELVEERDPWWDVPALLMDWLGGHLVGIVIIPVGVFITLLILRQKWAAIFWLVASIVSAGLVQLLKNLFGRARPDDILVASDFGSFPSGHVANAATIATIFVLLYGLQRGRWWLWIAGAAYTVAMMLARTYLGAHWITDTIGGLLIGMATAVIVWVPLASRLKKEQNARRATDSVAFRR